MLGKLPETGMEAVLATTVGVTVDQHRLHIIVEDGARHPADGVEEPLMGVDQGRSFVVNQTKLHRLKPSVATNADSRSLPRRIDVQSICA